MNLKTILIIIGIVAALLFTKFFFFPIDASEGAPGSAKPKSKMPINVTVYVVKPLPLDNKLVASGTVMANEEVELKPEIAGKLVAIYFKEGTTVQKGALLARINDADLQAQMRKLQIQLKLSKEREARLKGLLEIGGVSQEEFDAVAVQTQSLAADIDYTRAQIGKTEIRAPFTGKIGLRLKSEGAYVSSSDILAKMQQTDVLKIDFTLPERYAQNLSIGDEVSFSVENNKEKRAASIFAIEPKIDQQTRNVSVRALYKNSQSKVFPGSFAKIGLSADKKENALMIPTQAIVPELKGKKVFVLQSGKAMPKSINTGARTDAMVEVAEGLNAGDTVVVTGVMSLKPQSPVNIIGFKN